MQIPGAPRVPHRGARSSQATPATVDIHGRPRFARLSHVSGEHEKDADIHPAFRRMKRFGPDGIRWLVPLQLCELKARYPRQVWPAPVLPVLPSTIDYQSNLRRESVLLWRPAPTARTTVRGPARASRRRPCPTTTRPTPFVRSCWPLRRPQCCDVDGRPTSRANRRLGRPSFEQARPWSCHHGSAVFEDRHCRAC